MELSEKNIAAAKYTPYDQWPTNHIENLQKKVQRSKWRLAYHIQPETGLLNDPNGFSFFNGKWHLFYQSFPFGTFHGLKSWYHVESVDLVHWENRGLAIPADTAYDSHGAYSGSAIPLNDQLRLFYTGNVRNKDWTRSSFQLGATMDTNGDIAKLKKPLIAELPEGYTSHFRDPQVFEYQDRYLMLIGAQTEHKEGHILIYESDDLLTWSLLGPLNFTDQQMGYMIECPHLVRVNKTPILIFCPQGLDQKIVSYQNSNPNCYLIADELDVTNRSLLSKQPIKRLDDGFDVYATQAIDAPDGRTLAISWLGLPEQGEYPVSVDGWTNCLSLVKELTIIDNHLYQYPVKEFHAQKTLVYEKQHTIDDITHVYQANDNCYELEITIPANKQGDLYLLADKQKNRYLQVTFDSASGIVHVDRSKVGLVQIEETNSVRTTTLPNYRSIKMNIFVDHSSIEIFFNEGYKVLSGLVFPEQEDTNIWIEGSELTYKERLYTISL
ncbi:sucrose-6-phosphate hydrolase [Gracilibacillus alcaliphilus]|uniref:sucrose-6-phosphate hydrolase n=1 Tax=Gracilibacillus alcaliphilus TaxID=1401441 RepID=UPI00195B9B47|nr:sucrose-6-phosphate hydrolase [Gracilibacillus alcaliphilus]MBM7675603.1 beta-fructofuranosidase [Gracilibacillus alcaliphilus]